MNTLYFKYIEYRIRRMDDEQASIYLVKFKLSKAQKMQLMMDRGMHQNKSYSIF